MKAWLLAALFFIPFNVALCNPTCTQVGHYTSCTNGVTYTRIGKSTYGTNGAVTTRIGKTTVTLREGDDAYNDTNPSPWDDEESSEESIHDELHNPDN